MPAADDPAIEEIAGESVRKGGFAALRFGDFRLLWMSTVLGNTGHWMQFTALGFLAVRTAPTVEAATLRVAYVALAQTFAAIAVAPAAGVVADVFARRTILWNANMICALCAACLALMVENNVTNLFGMLAVAAVAGAARSIDAPARRSWVPELVDRDCAGNAAALHALALTLPSVIGPILAGVLLALSDPSAVFIANAIFTLSVVGAVSVMRPARRPARAHPLLVRALREGAQWLVRHPTLRVVGLGLLAAAFLARPYLLLLPAYGLLSLRTTPAGLSLLYAASGAGCAAGALASAYIGRAPFRLRLWTGSGAALGISLVFAGFARGVADALPWMFFAGAASMLFTGTANILLQTLTPERLRTRAVGAYATINLAAAALGALMLAAIAAHEGLRGALETGGAAFFLIAVAMQVLLP